MVLNKVASETNSEDMKQVANTVEGPSLSSDQKESNEQVTDISECPPAKVILGKSLPRSGHHFLVRLLASYLKADFRYCEIYTNADCCQLQPCKYDYPGLLFIQKSHDFKLEDTIPEDCRFLIQYRHPIPRLFSDWKLAVSSREDLENSFENFVKFSRNRKRYYVDFFKKWVIPFQDDDNFFMMSYEALTGETFDTLKRFLQFSLGEDFEVSREPLENKGMSVILPPHLSNHEYYDVEFLAEYQDSIIEQVPDLPYLPLKL